MAMSNFSKYPIDLILPMSERSKYHSSPGFNKAETSDKAESDLTELIKLELFIDPENPTSKNSQ
jgi:hypothetical protein